MLERPIRGCATFNIGAGEDGFIFAGPHLAKQLPACAPEPKARPLAGTSLFASPASFAPAAQQQPAAQGHQAQDPERRH